MAHNAVVGIRADPLYSGDIVHGEGPVWLAGRIAVLDMLQARVLLLDPAGRLEVVHSLPSPVVALVRERRGGGVAAVLEHEIQLLDAGWTVQGRHPVVDDPRVRFNEGAVTPDGVLLCGTMAYDQSAPLGTLFGFDGHHVQVVRDGITISNGLQFASTGEGRFIDSARGEVEVVRWNGQGMDTSRVLARFVPDEGMPDGLALDAAGGTWVALFGGGRVVRLDRDGRPTHQIDLPTPDATSCAFVGPARDRLVITTSALRTGDSDHHAGTVFIAEPPHPGVATPLCSF
ncbi:MAG: SMP-30/gluconolactonase/LRE family protein [Phycicoccus sp.]